jgi:high affinity sulfate transporter 1
VQLRGYRPEWLRNDITAGLAIAAVGLPSAIAYPALAGLPPEVGLYASIAGAIGYAVFGSSRQLIVGPDAGTVMMLAAVLAPLALASPHDRIVVSAAIAGLVGLLCFLASLLKLGFVANLLSRPIMSGFMTGISLSILVGQIGRLTGVKIESDGLLRPLFELATKVHQIHWPSLALGAGLFVLLRVLAVWLPAVPGPLVAVVLGTALSAAFDFPGHGIHTVGSVPSQLPSLMLPIPHAVPISDLVLGSVAVMIVSFGAGIVTARSFGAKNKYPVDANRELIGFGAANVACSLFGGFAVTSSDSRTAINDSMGGRTQVAGLVSAAALALTVLFLSNALALLPTPALGAVLASAALGLIDLSGLRGLWRLSRIEFALALISIAGVVVLGVLKGVAIAVGATLFYLLMTSVQPRDAMLGRRPGREGFYKLHRHEGAEQIAGLAIYLLESSLLFFNVDYVNARLQELIAHPPAGTKWLIFNASGVAQIDSTALIMLDDVLDQAAAQGLKFGFVEVNSEPLRALERAGLVAKVGPGMVFDNLEDVLAAFNRAP